LEPGARLRYGELHLDYDAEGLLRACDPYGCVQVLVPYRAPVDLVPTYPVHRPQRVADCVYVELEEELVVTGSRFDGWAVAPFDVEVRVGDTVVAQLSPTRVKYTLVGGLDDGYVCRYYRSPLVKPGGWEGLVLQPGEALVEFSARGSGVLRGLGMLLPMVRLYVGSSTVAYARLEVEVGSRTVTVRATGRPSLGADLEESPATRRAIPGSTSFTYPS
jgi:hypothetical protein